ncbi:hypothetical protein F5Y16DRAFT_394089 [Xylariaceae sp. FL0255]|nr:hypothetical protein F5Y16DRAFT_394089 [Xylariaceae sp. FL0255]
MAQNLPGSQGFALRLWEHLRVQLDKDTYSIKMNVETFGTLGPIGEESLINEFRATTNKVAEFFHDSTNDRRIYLADRVDLVLHNFHIDRVQGRRLRTVTPVALPAALPAAPTNPPSATQAPGRQRDLAASSTGGSDTTGAFAAAPSTVTTAQPNKAKKSNKRKGTKDPLDRKASNSFCHYKQKMYHIHQAEHPEMDFGELSKYQTKVWHSMTPAEKAPYEKMFEDEKAELERLRAERDAREPQEQPTVTQNPQASQRSFAEQPLHQPAKKMRSTSTDQPRQLTSVDQIGVGIAGISPPSVVGSKQSGSRFGHQSRESLGNSIAPPQHPQHASYQQPAGPFNAARAPQPYSAFRSVGPLHPTSPTHPLSYSKHNVLPSTSGIQQGNNPQQQSSGDYYQHQSPLQLFMQQYGFAGQPQFGGQSIMGAQGSTSLNMSNPVLNSQQSSTFAQSHGESSQFPKYAEPQMRGQLHQQMSNDTITTNSQRTGPTQSIGNEIPEHEDSKYEGSGYEEYDEECMAQQPEPQDPPTTGAEA